MNYLLPRQEAVVDDDEIKSSIHSLAPLPPVLSHGLIAVSFFGFLSFFTCVALLGYLIYQLIKWNLRPLPPGGSDALRSSSSDVDSRILALKTNALKDPAHNGSSTNHRYLADEYTVPQADDEALGGGGGGGGARRPRRAGSFLRRLSRDPPNQFLVLIMNLLFADIQQALGFALNVQWLVKDALEANTPVCWAQGWFVGTGDLASSIFISFIAIHTWLAVVKGYKMPTWGFYTMILSGWFFNTLLGVLGVALTNNGADTGGLYVRAGAWCWYNSAYQDLRLLLHYLWIFISLVFTSCFYALTFIHIQTAAPGRNAALPLHPHLNQGPAPSGRGGGSSSSSSRLAFAKQQTFLLYPLIYVCCTSPLAAGRVASMADATPSLGYFCFAGAMIASNGWLDAALYASTRRSILFSDSPPTQDLGLETFAFMRTPHNRKFGNVVFVSGGGAGAGAGAGANNNIAAVEGGEGDEAVSPGAGIGGIMGNSSSTPGTIFPTSKNAGPKRKNKLALGKLTRMRGESGSSQDSLRGADERAATGSGSGSGSGSHVGTGLTAGSLGGGAGGGIGAGAMAGGMAIQMETVTSVVVEVENTGVGSHGSSGRKGSLASDEISIASRF